MDIGLFGGTFNPIHLGHIYASQKVKKEFALNKIYLIPSALPPHKETRDIARAEDRLEMIRLSVSDDPDLSISDVELKRSGPSYTVDTVRHFKTIFPQSTLMYLILGLDAFLEIDTWKSYMDLFLLTAFIVMLRPGMTSKTTLSNRDFLEGYLQSRISTGYHFSAKKSCCIHVEKQPIFFFNADFPNISSTLIRHRLRTGEPIQSLVPKAAADYIQSKRLYR